MTGSEMGPFTREDVRAVLGMFGISSALRAVDVDPSEEVFLLEPPDAVDEAAISLLRFRARVDTTRHGESSCLGVITSTGAGGRREDGVHVIPIGCLGL